MKKCFLIASILCLSLSLHAKGGIETVIGDSTKKHVFTLSAELRTRGEYLNGALADTNQTMAAYIMARTRLSLNYKQPYLEVQITPQHADMWGGDEVNVFSLREAWAQTDYKGLFAKLGRQALCYDDERIIGLDDWSLTGAYHDCLKIGYEGHGHKVHALGAYNQTYKNALGGTIYKGGVQDYKNMQALWYHYDFKRWFSASLLFTNTGMQSADTLRDSTFYQQLLGTYVKFHYPGKQDWWIDLDASFYYQMGRSERGLPINAWMFATEGKAQINRFVQARAGYFILSGDENYTVPPPGGLGLQNLTHDHSFNLLYASHHQFYGAMDFFYLETFYGGYSPGLQDAHVGGTFLWKDQCNIDLTYHALATSVDVTSAPSRFLGHELEFTAEYRPFKWLSISAGYTYMHGTKTMEIVKRTPNRNTLHWAYVQLVFNPNFLTARF